MYCQMQHECSVAFRHRPFKVKGSVQVNAILGGVLANEVLKAVSGQGEPLDNLFMYRYAP